MRIKALPLLLTLSSSLLLGGCLGDVMEIFCEGSPDSDHCYQTAAIQESNPDDCANVKGEGFSGTNPPKDKCHLLIAENTGDPSACEGIEGGFMSYSKEDCLAAAFKNHTVEDCANVEDEAKCRSAWAKNNKGCGDGYWLNKEKGACEKGEAPGSDDGIDSKVEADLKTIGDAAKGKYMDLLTSAIESETDPDKLHGLQAYKDFLGKAGEKLEDAQTNLETLEKLKRIFIDSYDPTMDIDRMKVDKILEKGLFERMKDKVFGADDPQGIEKENAQADDALAVYETMLKRQSEIDFLKKGKLERLGGEVASALKDAGADKIKDTATEIAEGVAGTAFGAVSIVGDALKSFQDEAQKQSFTALVRAYNRRREDIDQKRPDLSPEQRHAMTVQQVQDDPYQDMKGLSPVRFENILANKDCQDEGNPLCIDNRVWWTAMDKTYQFEHKR